MTEAVRRSGRYGTITPAWAWNGVTGGSVLHGFCRGVLSSALDVSTERLGVAWFRSDSPFDTP